MQLVVVWHGRGLMTKLNKTHGDKLLSLCTSLVNKTKNSQLFADLIEKEIEIVSHTKVNLTVSQKRYLHYLDKIKAIYGKNGDLSKLRNTIYREMHKKTKFVIYTQDLACWGSLESVYKALERDDRCEVTVVYVNFVNVYDNSSSEEFEIYRKSYCPTIVSLSKYDLQKASPDVAIFVKPYDEMVPEEARFRYVEHCVDYTIYVPYGMEFNTGLIKYAFNGYLHAKVWRHIGYGPVVLEYGAYYGYRNGSNIVDWGHPKGDYSTTLVDIPKQWLEKIRDRKVILWTPHHSIDTKDPNHVGTWIQWSEQIIDLFKKNKSIVLLFRPHPLLFKSLLTNEVLNESSLDELIDFFNTQDNMILDDGPDYRPAFQISNALITDGTTFSVEYLYTRKPEAVTIVDKNKFYKSKEFCEAVQIIDSQKDLVQFVKEVEQDLDLHKRSRNAFMQRYFTIPNGVTIGQNIVNHTLEDMNQEIVSMQFGVFRAI